MGFFVVSGPPTRLEFRKTAPGAATTSTLLGSEKRPLTNNASLLKKAYTACCRPLGISHTLVVSIGATIHTDLVDVKLLGLFIGCQLHHEQGHRALHTPITRSCLGRILAAVYPLLMAEGVARLRVTWIYSLLGGAILLALV